MQLRLFEQEENITNSSCMLCDKQTKSYAYKYDKKTMKCFKVCSECGQNNKNLTWSYQHKKEGEYEQK